jgi:hypothetical protein
MPSSPIGLKVVQTGILPSAFPADKKQGIMTTSRSSRIMGACTQ